jgi:hypothetical protein
VNYLPKVCPASASGEKIFICLSRIRVGNNGWLKKISIFLSFSFYINRQV